MKQILLSLLISAIFTNSAIPNHNQQQGNIIISGEILNYENYPDQQFVEIFIYDPFAEPTNEILYLNEKGTFQLEFRRLYPQEISISFVFMAASCSEKSWKATISEQKLTGNHYLHDDNQYATLSKIFGFSGIPHYVLIDKQGKVIFKNAPRPSEGKILMNKFEELLR